ncbi:prefoldin [Chloropicon primus]|uniref:Prefoldin n=1 Tax=Chloropicon primus TaxID=1764295 RepID=A0A5B8MV05_9CHLO|nr:prefoldin [Chloropicon primus]UPR02806.1 prefoldin [Chloropicon primus]|eukprot:QDZ23594.1 prefoldin [Chloropicon primus]
MSGVGADGVKEEDRKAFLDLQRTMFLESQKLKKLEQQQRQSQVEKRKNELCLQELGSLPPQVNCYRTIGRTFVLVNREDMCRELEQSCKDNEEFFVNSKDKKVYLEKQVREAEENIRELLRGAPLLAKQIAGVQ